MAPGCIVCSCRKCLWQKLSRIVSNVIVRSDGMVRTISRVNGWSLPPHPLQILAWLVVLFLTLMTFGLVVPAIVSLVARIVLYVVSRKIHSKPNKSFNVNVVLDTRISCICRCYYQCSCHNYGSG